MPSMNIEERCFLTQISYVFCFIPVERISRSINVLSKLQTICDYWQTTVLQ